MPCDFDTITKHIISNSLVFDKLSLYFCILTEPDRMKSCYMKQMKINLLQYIFDGQQIK